MEFRLRRWHRASYFVGYCIVIVTKDSLWFFVAAFNQTERGRQQGGKGTGLGLALVRQIVKLSGGRLGVRSKVGHGSTFWVELRKCRLSQN